MLKTALWRYSSWGGNSVSRLKMNPHRCSRPKAFSTSLMKLRIVEENHDWPEEGKKYHGFKYYPRPGEVDPHIEPSRLFMVQRIKVLTHQPYWIKKIIEKLKLDTDQLDKAIVKNTPEVNKMLWTVKHLVKITPITFPYGMPKEGDQGYLNDEGQYILIRKVGAEIDGKKLEASHKFFKDPLRLDADTLKKKLRDIWLTSRK